MSPSSHVLHKCPECRGLEVDSVVCERLPDGRWPCQPEEPEQASLAAEVRRFAHRTHRHFYCRRPSFQQEWKITPA